MRCRLRRRLAVFLAASNADAITVTPEALRWFATMAAFVGGFLGWCYVVSLIS